MAITREQLEELRRRGFEDRQILSALKERKVDVPRDLRRELRGPSISLPSSREEAEQRLSSTIKKTGGTADLLDSVFGGGVIGRALGVGTARKDFINSEQGKKLQSTNPKAYQEILDSTLKRPKAKDVAGDVARTGVAFVPLGKIAQGLTILARAAKLGPKMAKIVGSVGAGSSTGFALDLTEKIRKPEEEFVPAATIVGGVIPSVGPAFRGISRLFGEAAGVTTGSGFGVINQALQSTKSGGVKAEAFKKALRGEITPANIAKDARNSLSAMKAERARVYLNQLNKLKQGNQKLDITPIQKKFEEQLDKFNVSKVAGGKLDFSRSAVRFDKKAQNEISTIYEEMKKFGLRDQDKTVIGVDLLKQSFDDLFTESSNVRAFTQAMRKEAKDVAMQVDGYSDLVNEYSKSTRLISELEKGLAIGDKKSIDTAFRKLSTSLRVNNEFRKELVDQLDTIAGDALSSKIAGQQLSEWLPRGIMRQLAGVGAIGGVASGVGIIPLLKAAVTTSPRVIGEFVGALGLVGNKANVIKNFLIDLSELSGVDEKALQRLGDVGEIQAIRGIGEAVSPSQSDL